MERNNKKIAKIFTPEQQFPCGPKSSCCGPIGQSEQEVMTLKNAIQKLGVEVEIYDLQKIKNLQEHPPVFKFFQTFGPQAIPLITVGDEVACMGQSEINETISAVKSKLGCHESRSSLMKGGTFVTPYKEQIIRRQFQCLYMNIFVRDVKINLK